ncbi:MAG: hypothetical protein FWD57_00030 [Polyangiaceae bacterium]|nr:hypothetical protein [Polyangiaceae bacterium]
MLIRRLAFIACAALAVGCGSPGSLATDPRTATISSTPSANPTAIHVGPSRWIPDTYGAVPIRVQPDGTKLWMENQMRMTEEIGGALRMAPDLVPKGNGPTRVVPMPSRLGGGYLFIAATDVATRVWRAKNWLAPLEPLLKLGGRYGEAIAGFDRMYAYEDRGNGGVVAFDPESGALMDLRPLPMPLGRGPMVFADAWTAVATADIRGALATFDAGASWIPLETPSRTPSGIPERVTALRLESGSIIITTTSPKQSNETDATRWTAPREVGTAGSTTSYALDPSGRLTPYSANPVREQATARAAAADRDGPGILRTLRHAIERGFPVSSSRVLLAHSGELLDVDVADGSVLRRVPDAYPRRLADCHGIALGSGIGFVCGAHNGPTVVYAYSPPGNLRVVLEFSEPKAVYSSGNGAIVVRTPCPESAVADGLTQYCVLSTHGNTREIRFEERGTARVVGLSDGRVVILVAPHLADPPGAGARLVVVDGAKTETRHIVFDGLSDQQRAYAQSGLWLHGVIEIEPGVLGVWAEGGDAIVGLRIRLDGTATSGPVQIATSSVYVSGRVGIVWNRGGIGFETVDGGMTWSEIALPSSTANATSPSSGCSYVGCAAKGWLRVGWGLASADTGPRGMLPEAPEPQYAHPPVQQRPPVKYTCAPTGRVSSSVDTSVANRPRGPGVTAPSGGRANPRITIVSNYDSRQRREWGPFGSLRAPVLARGEVGIVDGLDYGDFRFRVFVWGPSSSDWMRAGRWMVAIDDPYDAVGLPAVSSRASSPWPDANVASSALYSNATAVADAGWRSAVFGWCTYRGGQCRMFGITDGQEPIEFEIERGTPFPTVRSVVKVHDGWFLLGRDAGVAELRSADASGRVRLVRRYPRSDIGRSDELRLVRRSQGSGIALWLPGAGSDVGRRVTVLPIDGGVESSSGDLLSVQDGWHPGDGGKSPALCLPGEDGWVVDVPLSTRPRLPNGVEFGSSMRMRMRVDGARACVEAMTGRAAEGEILFEKSKHWLAANAKRAIPMVVWDHRVNRKTELACVPGTE